MTILDSLLNMLQQAFIQRAFLAGVILAILSSILSVFIVLKRVSLIGDGLGHTAFGGLALGYFLGVQQLVNWVASIVVVLGSMGITKAIRSTKISSDAAVALFLQLGLAAGGVLLSLSRGFGVNLESLLFGSIILVNYEQIYIALIVLGVTLAIVFSFYKELVLVTFDETQAKAAGVRTWFFDYLVSALAGVVVISTIPIVGVLLISALLVLPALTSLQVSRSFKQTMILSPAFGLLTIVLGLLLCIILDTAPGATIVVVGLTIFLFVVVGRKLARWGKRQI
jgi:zinc transport system permease protein